ncbi:hypothetical protein [Gemmobacter lutimaris]|nr:hypothetical protein [Gemmobacter lutimaris]
MRRRAADVVVMGGDVEGVGLEELGSVGIALTICGGRITYEGSGFA